MYKDIRKKIKNNVQVIRVQTTLGTSVTITKKQALTLIDTLERRQVKPDVDFTEIGNGKMLMAIQ